MSDPTPFYLDKGSLLLAQDIVLAITAVILAWYSIETRLLRKVQQWPLVIVQSLDDHNFVVTNVGNSPALNVWVSGYSIRIEDLSRRNYDTGDQLRSSNTILYLAPGDPASPHADRFIREQTQWQQSHTSGEAHLTDSHAFITLRVGYQNLAMQSFYAEEIIHTGSIKLLRSGKIRKVFHRAGQDFLKVLFSNDGQIERVRLTRKGQRQLTKPLRP